MILLDFENRENKKKGLKDVNPEYISYIKEKTANSKYYPKYHLAPKHGLMNDPNGLIEIDGWYHIFYQWFPLGPVHGLKYWYHLKTKDFINYVDCEIGIEPDCDLDKSGCYSGMIFNEEPYSVYYTGVDKNDIQNVCVADFDKENKITNKSICVNHNPKMTTRNFRDPFVFIKEKTKYMIVGAEDLNNKGQIQLFKEEGNVFVDKGFLNLGNEKLGYMLECPNLISFEEGKDVLLFSPQGIESTDKYTYRNVFSVAYGVGKLDVENGEFSCSKYLELDKGFDFYAPQVFVDSKKRHILLAWLGNSKCVYPSDKDQWAHMMTIPRELKLIDNILCQYPVEEIKELRQEAVNVEHEMKLKSNTFELDLEAEGDFSVILKNNEDEFISFSSINGEYILDRSNMTHLYNEKYGMKRYAKRINKDKNKDKVRIFVDVSSIEIFVDYGFNTFTSRFYLDDFDVIQFNNCNGTLYYLDPINISKEEI